MNADLFIRGPKGKITNAQVMFIRFVSGEIDEDSQVAAGLFCAVTELSCSLGLPDYEADALKELEDWFDVHLESPLARLPSKYSYASAICWFKSTATEHLERARELITILERNNVFIWTLKSERAGTIYYEDEFQVFAAPSYDRWRKG